MDSKFKNERTIKWWKTCDVCNEKFEDQMSTFLGSFPIPVALFKSMKTLCTNCKEKQRSIDAKNARAICLNHNFEDTKNHFLEFPAYEGQSLIVLDTKGHTYEHILVQVINPCYTKQKRIVVDYVDGFSGNSYYRTGQSCLAPKGQCSLLPFNDKVAARILEESTYQKNPRAHIPIKELCEILELG